MGHPTQCTLIAAAFAFAGLVGSAVHAQTSASASATAPKTRAEVKAEVKASRPKGALPSQADIDQMGNPEPTPRQPRASTKPRTAASAATRP